MSSYQRFPINSDEGLAEAKKRIADCSGSGASFLNLSELGLTKIPDEVFSCDLHDFSNLEVLNLRGNRIEHIPTEIGSILSLKVLVLSSNQFIGALPETICQLSNLERLEANGNRLAALPETIGGLTVLNALELDGNQLTVLPESISQLSCLETLTLESNRLTFLPEAIGLLSSLKALSLQGNQLDTLPESIRCLSCLKSLNLSWNQLSTLSEAIGLLSSLKTLSVQGNQLTTLPETIGRLSCLGSLDLSGNQLTILPESIGQLSCLETLDLKGNQLTTLSESIGHLSSLNRLDIRGNQLTTLPETIGQLSCLRTLHLSGNQLSILPQSIGQLVDLFELTLAENRLVDLPKTILRLPANLRFSCEDNSFPQNVQWALDNAGLGGFRAVAERASDATLTQPFLKPFPEPEAVFVSPVERYARHLHPLVSIELSAVDSALSGWIHLVSPIEPSDGYLGDSGEEHWGPYLQPNWIGFRLTQDHRYELLVDFRFFGIENTSGKESYKGAVEDLEEFYQEMHTSFAEHKAAYLESGHVCRIRSHGNPRRVAMLSHLGGEAPVGNMTWSEVPGVAFTYSDIDRVPMTLDGRFYRFIAAVPGWNYRESGADKILLYYDSVERVALQTFVFT